MCIDDDEVTGQLTQDELATVSYSDQATGFFFFFIYEMDTYNILH